MSRRLTYSLVPAAALALAASCSGEPAPICATGEAVEVYWSGPPGTLFFRDGDADWTESSSSDRGVHTLCVTSDRYVVSSGCRMGDTVAIREHFGMTADGGVVVIGTCFGAPVDPVEPVELMTVRGTVRQPGNVFIAGQWRSGSTSDWEFEHTIPRDTYDVLAVEALQRPSSVLIRRGLAASTEIVEPPLDFTTEGLPMTVAVPSITGLDAADRVSTDTVLELGGHIAVVAILIADVAHLVPAAVRGDATQHVTVAAFRDEGPAQSFLRLETRVVEGEQVEVELLPELRAVTFEPAGLGARWDAVEVPGVTGVTLNLTSSGVSQAITASPTWLATSDYRLAPDVTAPAYGGLEPLVQVRRSFYAEVDTDARYRASIVSLEASALDTRASVLERLRERQRARGR